jgi:Transposase DDE domain
MWTTAARCRGCWGVYGASSSASVGYISQPLAALLKAQELRLVTKLRKNMKNKFLALSDKLRLRKRALIETVND